MSKWGRTIEQGLLAGLIGFGTIAGVFAIVDLVSGRSPFYTAAVLGNALFYGVQDPSFVTVSIGAVLGYSMVHLVVFLVFGMAAAALATLADRGLQLWFVALFFFIFISFHLYAAAQAVAAPMREALPGALVWGAGVAASLVMAAYLIRVHPRMRAMQPW